LIRINIKKFKIKINHIEIIIQNFLPNLSPNGAIKKVPIKNPVDINITILLFEL